jgi:DNA-binding NtrC family response regulator
MDKYAKRNGIGIEPLSDEDVRRLESYSWPGNIRELQNVIERGVITSSNGRLNLERALPASKDNTVSGPDIPTSGDGTHVLSDRELKELERKNIVRALEKTGWKVAGKDGAAAILGIPTSTLNSKIKSFGIEIPSK